MSKCYLDFSGMEKVMKQFEEMGGNVKEAAEDALKATHQKITPGIEKAWRPHNIKYTGNTGKSIVKDPHVEWEGLVAGVDIGFDITNGGMPSIYLMYGTPRITPDRNLYNSIYGSKTRKEAKELQREIIYKKMGRLGR